MLIETFASLSAKVQASLLRALRNGKFERTPDGLLLPRERLMLRGLFVTSLNGGPEQYDPNLVVTEGQNHLLNVTLRNQAASPSWYVALFKGNVTPSASWTAANFSANATEFTSYSEPTRPQWVPSAASGGSIDNLASKATFTITANDTVYGGALLSASTKSGTTGVLMAATLFSKARAVQAGDQLQVGYQLTITST
jgi:hypothetical protein